MLDISQTTEPRSDQQNADDYLTGPKNVTIAHVKRGSAEQPVELHLVEYPGRPYKPGKSMRRVLVNAWGSNGEVYVGRRMRLYNDPTIKFGKDTVGGIRIEALSHIDGPVSMPLTVTRGKRSLFTVQPLAAADDRVTAHLEALAAASSIDALIAVWKDVAAAGLSNVPELISRKDEAKKSLQSAPEEVQS